VGVNIYVDENPVEAEDLFEPDPDAGDRQGAVLAAHLLSRDTSRVQSALDEFAEIVARGENIMPGILEAARAGATVGEIANVLRGEYGEYVEPVPW
jgi:methylmalonyl-CoA mutase N-terminal domain/subunit